MLRELLGSIRMLLVLTLLTGVAYPLAVTGVARLAFPRQAGGSLIASGGHIDGSELLGQAFADSGRFWSRPSATSAVPYDASASSGSNLATAQRPWRDLVAGRIAALRAADPGNTADIPPDLVMASASGLDPDISPAGADYQVARVARVRGLDPARLRALVTQQTQSRTFGLLGERRVNVMSLNRALDSLSAEGGSR